MKRERGRDKKRITVTRNEEQNNGNGKSNDNSNEANHFQGNKHSSLRYSTRKEKKKKERKHEKKTRPVHGNNSTTRSLRPNPTPRSQRPPTFHASNANSVKNPVYMARLAAEITSFRCGK